MNALVQVHATTDGQVSMGLSLFWLGRRRRSYVTIGWGWDAEVPLRPWPWWRREPGAFRVVLCGLFVNARTRRVE